MRRLFKAFTLLEIILVLAILGMVTSVVGWQIGACVTRYAFQREVEEIYNAIKQSQVLCLTYRTDISVQFFKENGTLYYCLKTDEPFTEIPFDREKKALKKVARITFNEKRVKEFELCIFSQADMEPRGVIGFFAHNKKEDPALWFDFQGSFLLAMSHHKPAALKERSPTFPHSALKPFLSKKQEDTLDVTAKSLESKKSS